MKRKKLSEMSDADLWSMVAMESAWNNPKDDAAEKFYIEKYLKKGKGKKTRMK